MKVFNQRLLKTIFSLKGNFTEAYPAKKKVFQSVEIAPFKNDMKATVCISADFELNWAWRELSLKERNHKGARARKNFPLILEILEEYTVPITWATVGHLFLKSCEREGKELPHQSMPRPPVNNGWNGDWYVHDPCTDVNEDPLWYAPDLIQQIIESNVPHEIATHSFSHVDFSPGNSDDKLIIREIEECIKVMVPLGLKPKSLVFPFNKMGYSYLDVLSDLGITSVRHRDAKVRLSYPVRTRSGVYKIYESMNLRSTRYYDYVDKAKVFVEEAAKRHAVYHLWFHPSDTTSVFENEFHSIIKYICDEREKGLVWIATMSELAAYCEARESVNLQVQKNNNEIKIFIDSSLDRQKYGDQEISLIIPAIDLPQEAFLQLNSHIIQNLKLEKFIIDKDCKKILVNVPTSAKALILRFEDPPIFGG